MTSSLKSAPVPPAPHPTESRPAMSAKEFAALPHSSLVTHYSSLPLSAGIYGIGSFVPEDVLTNADLEKLVETSDEWIVTRTGISERRIVGPGVATSDIATGFYRHILVIGADALSRVVNWTDRSTCVLFGDGAGAAVLGPVPDGSGLLAFDLGSDGSGAELLCVEAGGSRLPASAETVAKMLHTIRMSGSEVFKFAVRAIEESTLKALDRAGLTIADIDCFIAHQANIRILD